MKEIKLNYVGYPLRGAINRAIVYNETELVFKNGIAVAKAEIQENVGGQYSTYECVGLINEQFEEAFSDTYNYQGIKEYDGKKIAERNLMFFKCNKDIIRCGDNDFIITILCEDDSGSWEEHKHVRIVEGRPVLINDKLSSCKKTSHENLVIIGANEKRLYDVTTGEFITPALYEIKESENNSEVFNVIARVKPKENNPYNFEDFLCFKINTKGKKVSYVVSSHDGPIFFWDECSVTEMLDACAREIKYRAESFETYVDSLKNSEEYLSEYQGELQQSLKYMRKEDE